MILPVISDASGNFWASVVQNLHLNFFIESLA